MKTIEEIEKDYNSFKVKTDFVYTYKDFLAFMYLGLEETYEIEKDFKREIRKNKKDQMKCKIINTLLFQNDQNDIEYYEYDNRLMAELNIMILKYREIYQSIMLISTEDNYKELLKMMDFLTKYYEEHLNYYEHRRDRLEMFLKGISMSDSRYEDNQDSLYEFVDKKLTEIYTNNSNKVLVKSGKNT